MQARRAVASPRAGPSTITRHTLPCVFLRSLHAAAPPATLPRSRSPAAPAWARVLTHRREGAGERERNGWRSCRVKLRITHSIAHRDREEPAPADAEAREWRRRAQARISFPWAPAADQEGPFAPLQRALACLQRAGTPCLHGFGPSRREPCDKRARRHSGKRIY